MRLILGFGEPNSIDNWRRKLGNRYEHTEPRGNHRGVWLYAPHWIVAYCAARDSPTTPDSAPKHVDQDKRLKKIKADREELRYHNDLKVLLHKDDVARDVDGFANRIRCGIERLPPDGQAIMLEAIDEAVIEWNEKHGSNDSIPSHSAADHILPISERLSPTPSSNAS